MRNKIILTIALPVMLLSMSSCYMRSERVYGNHFTPRHTYRHYGREKHMNIRRAYWGKHRSGMRPYKHRGQMRF